MKAKFGILMAAAIALTAPGAFVPGAFASGKSQAKADGDAETAQVQETGPDGAVRALYSPYLPGGDERMSAFDNEAERAKRFTSSLTKELKAYFARQEKAGEPGGLDFDPIVNGQDYKIGQLEVRTDKTVAGKSAIVIAEFKNFDESARLKYKLLFEGGAWKVDDISSLSDPVWDLRDVLKAD
jgi:hypothetical protein